MPTINQLNSIDTPSGSDLLPLYSQSNGDARKLSLSNLLLWLTTNTPTATNNNQPQFTTQYAAPSATGFTVQILDGSESRLDHRSGRNGAGVYPRASGRRALSGP